MLLNHKIIEEFLRDLSLSLTGSYIAKRKKLNQKTVANYLNQLEQQQILKSKVQGKNKLYTLNLNNKEVIKNFILAVEHLRTLDFYKKNTLIKEISEKIQPFIKGTAVIFGSYVKGTAKKDSDLDLLIIGKCDEKEIEKVEKTYQIELNLKVYPKFITDILIKEVIKNHIIIKNTELFVGKLLDETN